MAARKDQRKVGIRAKPRGQQMGVAGAGDQNRKEMAETPALRGRRKTANKMFADKSSQHIGSDPSKPSTNSPSVPAMNTSKRKGESGGERVFKQRLKTKRAAK
ncbi:MAG TPA: hypothetical protein VIT88_07360 [Pyrinomonadaceae bacterium]